MDLNITPVHTHIINGECFSAKVIYPTATNANVRVGIGLFVNSIAKNIFIFSALANNSDTGEADVTVTTGTALDTNFTQAFTPQNMNMGSANTSLATVKNTVTANTAPTGTQGTPILVYRLTGQRPDVECFSNGSGILIPANTANIAINFYAKVPTAGKVGFIDIKYIEY